MGVILIIFLFIIAVVAISGGEDSDNITQNETPVNTEPQKPEDPIDRINYIVNGVGDFEVNVWDPKGNRVKADTPPPYEVIVNVGRNKEGDCFNSKYRFNEVVKRIYTDMVLKGKISRVLFTSWTNLRASIGYEDVVNLSQKDWDSYGPTYFWKITQEISSYENETKPMAQRTWGVNLVGCK